MPCQVTNRCGNPLVLRLRNGQTIHLRAGETTEVLEGAEVNGNPRIASLAERRLITIEDITPAKTGGGSGSGRQRAAHRGATARASASDSSSSPRPSGASGSGGSQ